MEMQGTPMFEVSTNVIFLSSIMGGEGPDLGHKCDWKCQNEHVCGNMYRCRLTGLTHICDKNCDQRILYDNHNSLCRVSGQIFPLTAVEEHAVRGVRRKFVDDGETSSPSENCSFKRRRDARLHPSPFERSITAGDEEQRLSALSIKDALPGSSICAGKQESHSVDSLKLYHGALAPGLQHEVTNEASLIELIARSVNPVLKTRTTSGLLVPSSSKLLIVLFFLDKNRRGGDNLENWLHW